MFGFRFVKFEPNAQVFVIRNGKTVREGKGLSFWYYAPSTSFIKVPLESKAAPFIFEVLSADFQAISVQGEIAYRVARPDRIKDQMNFTISSRKLEYLGEDPQEIDQKIVNVAKTIVKRGIEKLRLKDALKATDSLKEISERELAADPYLASLGLEVTNLSILAISPNAETGRALEAETRERILKEADDAIYERRNASVEQERTIKENELNTELAIEAKKRQIREAQVEAERAVQEKTNKLEAEKLGFQIGQESERGKLAELAAKNARISADSKAYATESLLKAFGAADRETLSILAQSGMNPEQLIAGAFDSLAQNAEKIGELNLSPDLLSSLLKKKG
jgi:hypothetical protein